MTKRDAQELKELRSVSVKIAADMRKKIGRYGIKRLLNFLPNRTITAITFLTKEEATELFPGSHIFNQAEDISECGARDYIVTNYTVIQITY